MQFTNDDEVARLKRRIAELEQVLVQCPAVADLSKRSKQDNESRQDALSSTLCTTLATVDVLESLADGFVALDANWRFTYVNSAAERLLKKSREYLLGKDHWEEYSFALGTRIEEEYRRSMKERIPRSFDFEANGRWFEFRVHPIRNGGIAVYFEESTPRKRAEAALRISEERFRMVLRSSPILVYTTDLDLRINWLQNPQGGYTTDDSVGKRVDEFLPPEDAAPIMALQYSVLKTGIGARDECRLYVNGELRYYDTTVEPLLDAKGNIAGLNVVSMDVTNRRLADERLRESEATLRMALSAGRMETWDWQIETGIVRRSPGLNREEAATTRTIDDFLQSVHPDDRDVVTAAIRRSLEQDEYYQIEFRIIDPEGQIRWVSRRGQVFRGPAGKPVRMIGVGMDITERKRAEVESRRLTRELQRRVAEFETLMDVIPVGISLAHDAECRRVTENRVLTQLLGPAPSSTLLPPGADPPYRIYRNGKELPPEERPLQKATATGRPVRDQELEVVLRDGRVITLYGHAAPLFDDDGRVRGGLSAYIDITSRHRAESELKEREERYRLSVKAAGGVIWDIHIPTGEMFWSDALETIFGYSRTRELESMESGLRWWSHHLHPEDRERVTESFNGVLKNRQVDTWAEEYRFRRGNGEYAFVLDRAHISRDARGAPVRIVGSMQDITERKRSEEERLYYLAVMESIAHNAAEAIFLLDTEGRPTFANPTAEDLFGWKLGELQGRRLHDVIHSHTGSGDLQEPACPLVAVFQNGTTLRNHEDTFYHRNGSPIRVEYSNAPIFKDGKVSAAVLVVHDITERQRAKEILEEANRGLHRMNENLRQFAYAAAHDLQEPLRMVNLYSQMLKRRFAGELGDQGREFLAFITDGARRMQNLVTDLLTFTQAGDTLDSPTEEVDCNQVLNMAMNNLTVAIAESGAEITSSPLPVVRAHFQPLVQLFQNLLSNAIKYRSEAPPRIDISVRADGPRWLFSIRDNGIGIAPDYHERIFGVFKRLHKDKYPGTGIGLAICARVVDRYGGRIWLESEEGKGSTFFFTLPQTPNP